MTEAFGAEATPTPRGLLLAMTEVAPAHEEEFDRWYVEEHLPERSALPGFVATRRFAALDDDAPRRLALVELERADVVRSEPWQRPREPTPWARQIRALSTLVRRVVYEEIADGAHVGPAADGEPRVAMLVMSEIPAQHEDEFNRWYTEEHLPERASLPGFVSARRFVATDGAPKYLAIYELESLDALESRPYREATVLAPTPWTERMRGLRTANARHLYREIGTAVPQGGRDVRATV